MPVTITCPRATCGHGHIVDDQHLGKTVPCPKCGGQITVSATPRPDAAMPFSVANFLPNLERLAPTAQARMLLWGGLGSVCVLALSPFLPLASAFGYSVLGVNAGAGV